MVDKYWMVALTLTHMSLQLLLGVLILLNRLTLECWGYNFTAQSVPCDTILDISPTYDTNLSSKFIKVIFAFKTNIITQLNAGADHIIKCKCNY